MTSRAAKSRGIPRKSKASAQPARRSVWPIVIGALVGVAVLAILAVFLSQPSSAEISEPADQPLTIEGGALPELPTEGADPAIGLQIPRLVGTGLEGQIVEINAPEAFFDHPQHERTKLFLRRILR